MNDSNLDQQVETLRRDLDALRSDMRRTASHAGQAGTEASQSAQDAARSALANLEAEAKRILDDLQNAGKGAVHAGEEAVSGAQGTIQDRPFLSTGAALGIGVVLGILLNRKS